MNVRGTTGSIGKLRIEAQNPSCAQTVTSLTLCFTKPVNIHSPQNWLVNSTVKGFEESNLQKSERSRTQILRTNIQVLPLFLPLELTDMLVLEAGINISRMILRWGGVRVLLPCLILFYKFTNLPADPCRSMYPAIIT